jgi:uncharacterized protein YciI
MKTIHLLIITFLFISAAYSQQNTGTQKKEVTPAFIKEKLSLGKEYVLVLFKKSDGKPANNQEAADLQAAHLKFLFSLQQEGKISIFGALWEEADLRGISIFNNLTKEEVKKILADEPLYKKGIMTYEIYQWFSIPGDKL